MLVLIKNSIPDFVKLLCVHDFQKKCYLIMRIIILYFVTLSII